MSKRYKTISGRQPIDRTVPTNSVDNEDNDNEDEFDAKDEIHNHNNSGTVDNESSDRHSLPKDERKSNKTSPYFHLTQEVNVMKRESIASREETPQRRRKETTKKAKEEERQGFGLFFWFVLTMIAVLTSFFLFDGKRYFQTYENSSADVITKWQTFESEFESFQRNYSEVIPIKGFKILNSSVKKVMNRNKWSQRLHNSSPAILLLIGSEDNENILKCVERDLVNAIIRAYNELNPIVINGRQTDVTDIVDKFDLNFRDEGKHLIIIENIESISAKDVMSLHQFTDHENAKYKDVIIVITAINYQKYNLTKNANPLQMDSIASQLFQIKWKNNLPEEQSFALISRLTPSVVTIIGQTNNAFKC